MNNITAPQPTDQMVIREVLHTNLGTLYFYDNVLVMEGKQDAVFSIKTGLFILLKVIKIVGTKPVVYISNRIHSYSVNPNDYKYLEMIPNLMGIATVSYSNVNKGSSQLEKQFFKKPFYDFDNLDAAKLWALELLETKLTG